MPTFRPISSLFVLLMLASALGVVAGPPTSPSQPGKDDDEKQKQEQDKEEAAKGRKAPKFSLEDTTGERRALEDYAGRTLVLIWINPVCPATARIFRDGQMQELLESLEELDRGDEIAWLGVCSNTETDASRRCEAFTRGYKIDLAVLMDRDAAVGKKFDARKTPHVFVIDGEGVIRYEGAFDDDPTGAKRKGGLEVLNYPLQAVTAIREDREVKPRSTEPYGLPIRYSPLGR